MRVQLEIPDLSGLQPQSPRLFLSRYFTGGGPAHLFSYALVVNFVRLVDLSVNHYESGRQSILTYWEAHDGVAIGAAIAASGHFESCITDVHRSMRYMKGLRSNCGVTPSLRCAFSESTRLLVKRMQPARDMRDAIHHFDEDIVHDRMSNDGWLCLIPDGEITRHEGQEIKRIDRLKLGDKEIRFGSLAAWLQGLNEIAAFSRSIGNQRVLDRTPAAA